MLGSDAMRDKVYFLTDAHLGAGDDSLLREHQLCRFLDTIRGDARMLILLGDMFDFWFSYRHVVPRGYIRFLGKLAELADDGVELHFFVGNHDMWIFDYLEQQMNIVMHNEPEFMEIAGRHFLVGHGDGLGHLDRHYDRLRCIFRSRMNQRLLSMLPEWITFGIACGWSHRSRLSHGDDVARYLGDEREGIVIYCREQMLAVSIDYCVFGHRHTPLAREIVADNGAKSLYVNVGDWLVHRSYAVFSPSEGLRLCDWMQTADNSLSV